MLSTSTKVLMMILLVFIGASTVELYAPISLSTMGKDFIAQVGAMIGVGASVPPNPINTIAQQLKDKALALNEREERLVVKEYRATQDARTTTRKLNIILGISGILLLMIMGNFYLDYKRTHNVV